MSRSNSEHHPQSPTKQPHLAAEAANLNYQSSYLCPICRHGQISGIALMDAFACNFCRHIFTANLTEQTVQVVDSSQPMSWRWNGRTWQVAYRDDTNLTVLIWVVGGAIVLLPSTLVWLSSHLFPPLPGSRWAWFPSLWLICTFTVHFLLVAWLMAEHYQFAFYVSSKIRLRALFNRR